MMDSDHKIKNHPNVYSSGLGHLVKSQLFHLSWVHGNFLGEKPGLYVNVGC